MAEIHDLLEARGRQHVLQLDIDRRVIDAASGYLSDEDASTAYIYSGWAQAALPHKRLPDDQPWQVRHDRASLLVEPGRKTLADGSLKWVGVPYGSRARLILLYLQTEALRTQSREIELGKSLRSWLKKLNISVGGKSAADVREQAERLTRCRLSFEVQQAGRSALVQQLIVDQALFTDEDSGGGHFLERTKLSEVFFEQLKRHPVPIEEAAIRAINRHSMALDIYCWLAYRLHILKAPTPVTWRALHAQFGGGIRRLDHFRETFGDQLALAAAVYPAAKLQVTALGVTLNPSAPPVAKRTVISLVR
ncbi:replication protein RepA [Lichenicoccus roseus]|uniref:Plasmid replication initiator n=1 Tax=Lichenicoccus roseus TaxID=2683649 RepID=A0A5R9J2K8_9PROT|nr:replication protein RepA [Lichenicoccus roseus]TLU70717.1 plasmid replication initiator [Lichenicoccus roseus]